MTQDMEVTTALRALFAELDESLASDSGEGGFSGYSEATFRRMLAAAAPAGEPACWYCGSAQEDECQGPLEVLCQRRRVAVVAGDGSEPAAWMRGPSTTSTSPVAITHWAKLNHGAKDAGGPGYTAEYTIPLYAAPRAPAPDAAPNLHPEHDAMIAEAEEFAQNNGSKDVRVFARNTARYLRALAALADGAAAPADEPERRP